VLRRGQDVGAVAVIVAHDLAHPRRRIWLEVARNSRLGMWRSPLPASGSALARRTPSPGRATVGSEPAARRRRMRTRTCPSPGTRRSRCSTRVALAVPPIHVRHHTLHVLEPFLSATFAHLILQPVLLLSAIFLFCRLLVFFSSTIFYFFISHFDFMTVI
jgi:hypothetical protein